MGSHEDPDASQTAYTTFGNLSNAALNVSSGNA
jgi:hypothetical protein